MKPLPRALFALVAIASSAHGGAPPGPEVVFNDAGYIHVGRARHLFYWFFESRGDPTTDPVILWLSGGPGCSSMLALFAENGPYSLPPRSPSFSSFSSSSLRLNPWAWNSNATVIWLDQPAGTGFSMGVPVHNEDQVASDVVSFLEGWFRRYPQHRRKDLYVFGESYAGHYVPHISAALVSRDGDANPLPFRFKGCAIGNGLTNPLIQNRYYAKYAKERDLVSEQQLALMHAVLPLCEGLTAGCNAQAANQSDPTVRALEWTACMNAYVFCNLGELLPVQSTGVNVYDVRRKCDPEHRLCYDFDAIEQYLDTQEVREALGVKKRGDWQACRPLVELALVYGGDWEKRFDRDVAKVLEAGVPVLVYAGMEDFICNHMGNEAWTRALRWSGARDFITAEEVSWRVGGREAGAYRSAEGLTFLKIRDAGHMVPMDAPEAALEMVNTFTREGFQPSR